MALTAEILKGSTALAELSEDQIKAITELSQNDENAVIAKKTGEIHGQYDRDIEEATGLKKPDGVKTYEWMKTDVLPKVKSAQTIQADLDKAKQEKLDLEKQLKEGKVDEALKQKLTDAEKLVTDLQKQLTDKETEYKTKIGDLEKNTVGIQVNNEFDRALVGKKFKDENIISKELRETFVSNAKSQILTEFTPDWVDNGKGGKTLVFRNKEGDIQRNPENNLHPFTAEELLTSKIKDVLDMGKKQPGAGTKPAGGKGGQTAELDLSGAKTQVEADDIAVDYLMSKGLTRGSGDFNTEFDKIREDNKVAELPLR